MNLKDKKCVPCEGGVPPLSIDQVSSMMGELDSSWRTISNEKIEREFVFKDFAAALSFLNKVAGIAEEEGHHPDLLIHAYKKLTITLSTHAIGGLSENDFILAAKIDSLG